MHQYVLSIILLTVRILLIEFITLSTHNEEAGPQHNCLHLHIEVHGDCACVCVCIQTVCMCTHQLALLVQVYWEKENNCRELGLQLDLNSYPPNPPPPPPPAQINLCKGYGNICCTRTKCRHTGTSRRRLQLVALAKCHLSLLNSVAALALYREKGLSCMCFVWNI